MTYYGSKDLAAAFRTVRDNTIKIAEDIPENKYDFRPAPDTRTVRETLAHLAVSTAFQSHVHANKITDMTQVNFHELFQKFSAEETKPRTKAELIAFLKDEGDKFAVVPRGPFRAVPRGTGDDAARRDAAADEEPLRDAAVGEGARDAPSRAAHDTTSA